MAKPDKTANARQDPGWGTGDFPFCSSFCHAHSASATPDEDESPSSHIPLQREATQIQEYSEPTEEDLLIATAVLYGFSLTDKLWLELNVAHVQPITWNVDAFENLVLPAGRKMLLQSLVEAHNAELSGFDDFVKGKGRGLVINLFGPPGVGKTLSAEATSERK